MHACQGEEAHKQIKVYYRRTNKINPAAQISKQERRAQILREIRARDPLRKLQECTQKEGGSADPISSQAQDRIPLSEHHKVSIQGNRHQIFVWLGEHGDDPATTVSASRTIVELASDGVRHRVFLVSY